MSDVDDLLSPTMVFRNKQGEIVLAMKRKGEKYGCLYYVFQLRLDRVPPEELVKFQVAWDFIKQISAKMGIPLHDVEEIKAKVEAEMRKPNFKEGDVTISVLDHATNTMRNLVVEVTKAPKPKHNP
jgi:hypothetical protein